MEIAKCEPRNLDDFSTFSALDYNLISFGIKRQTILVNNVLPLARVRSSYLAKDLLIRQTTCPLSQQSWNTESDLRATRGEENHWKSVAPWRVHVGALAGSWPTSPLASQERPCCEVTLGSEHSAFRQSLGWASKLLCFMLLCSAQNAFSFPDVSQTLLRFKANCGFQSPGDHVAST